MKNSVGFIVPSDQVKLRIETLLEEEVKNGKLIVETLRLKSYRKKYI